MMMAPQGDHVGDEQGVEFAAFGGLRVGGWLLLIVSIWPAVLATGWSQGLVEWCAVLMLSGLLLVLLLPYRPRLALILAGLGLLASPVAAFATL